MTRLIIAAAILLASCASTPPEPVLPELRHRLADTTVVLVPGVTGSKLRDRTSGSVVWGNTSNFLGPHDGGYGIALPIVSGEDAIESAGAIEELRLLTYRKEVYGTVVRLMEKNGLPRGERFFIFDYDWRRDNIAAARQLARWLEELGRSGERRRVALICQSNATYICRYLVRYGDVSLDDAEAGVRRPVTAVDVEKIILVGNSNGGALRILRELDRGRRYVKYVGRRFQPETLFTFRSLFQDLPAPPFDNFIGADGQPLPVDLYDTANWKKYGWSAWSRDARDRMARHPQIFGTEEDREAYLRAGLEAAKRLHALMQRVAPASDTDLPRFYSIQSDSFPTSRRAAIIDGRTRFFDDPGLKDEIAGDAQMRAPGDVHATVESQQFLSPSEQAALARPTIYVDEKHFEMITRPDAQRAILEILAE